MDELSFDEEEWEGVTMEAQDVVRQLLIIDLDQRLSASELLDIPWIQGEGGTSIHQLLPYMDIIPKIEHVDIPWIQGEGGSVERR
jgi:hypothetical protein